MYSAAVHASGPAVTQAARQSDSDTFDASNEAWCECPADGPTRKLQSITDGIKATYFACSAHCCQNAWAGSDGRSDYTHSVGFFPDLRTIGSTVGLVKHRQAKPPPTYLPTYLALRRPPAANLPTYLVIGGLIRASRPPGAKPTYLPSASRGLRPYDLPIPTYLTRYAVHVDGYCLM